MRVELAELVLIIIVFIIIVVVVVIIAVVVVVVRYASATFTRSPPHQIDCSL